MDDTRNLSGSVGGPIVWSEIPYARLRRGGHFNRIPHEVDEVETEPKVLFEATYVKR